MKSTLTLLALVWLLCLAPIGTAAELPPTWGSPSDNYTIWSQCDFGTWHTGPHQYDYCDEWSTLRWLSSVWQHHYVTPYEGLDCYDGFRTYAGYGTPQPNLIWCADHGSLNPVYYETPHPRAARWASTLDRGEHYYVRNPGPSGYISRTASFQWAGKCLYYPSVKCYKNSDYEHILEFEGPNDWVGYGQSCIP